MKNHPYYEDFVKIYNASVKHDNKIGKHDEEHAIKLAEAYAEIHVFEWHQELFVEDFAKFYYNMFN